MAADSTPDDTITAEDYLNSFKAVEEEADLVLGADDGNKCTYPDGYLPRQAIFSCLSCTPQSMAGFCVACALHCHDGHQVEELHTKRKFRCDCGNSKFGGFTCQLYDAKEDVNADNAYNHNFAGKYCSCRQPYPNPEHDASDGEENMIQCCICEDWFHEHHLGLPDGAQLPVDEEGEFNFEELICAPCTSLCSFLHSYPHLLIESEGVAVKSDQEDDAVALTDDKLVNGCHSDRGRPAVVQPKEEVILDKDLDHCKIGSVKLNVLKGPLFMANGWREDLCRCQSCLKLYADSRVAFLTEDSDTISLYEENAKRKRKEEVPMEDRAMAAFMTDGSLSHVQKMEMLHGFNDMAAKLKEFLQPFSQNGEVVTAEDVSSFFEGINRKRQRHK